QFSNQFTSDCNAHDDGATITGSSDFVLTLASIDVVNANGDLVSGVSVTSDSTTAYRLAGDVNGDGFVDGRDIGAFVAMVGQTTPAAAFYAADLNHDGIVDGSDAPLMAGLLTR